MTDGTSIEKVITEDVSDIIKGVTELGQLITQLPTDLQDCKGMQGDISRIEKWAAIFQDPSKLASTVATNVIKNFAEITSDVSKIGTDFSGQKYEAAGEDIADMLVATLGPVPAQ